MTLRRKFNNRIYRLDSQHQSKFRALSRAERLRRIGYKARVALINNWTWGVWRK